MARGRYIVLEGGEAVGKSTQVRRLAERLTQEGIANVTLREPGGDPFAEAGRALLLGDLARAPETEVLVFNALRAQLLVQTVRPHLDAGTWVVSDRGRLSTLAYQGYGHGVDLDWTRRVDAFVAELCLPDLEVVMTVDDETARARRVARGVTDRFELLDEAFHRRVVEGYRAEAEALDLPLVDASGSEDEVERALWAHVEPLLRVS